MFDSNLVITDLDVKNQEEALTVLANKLRQYDLVKPTFRDAILKRESKFPTGLHTDMIDVAIPHTDTKYVNEASICVATLEHPVEWHQMGASDIIVHPTLIMMLAIKDQKRQVGLLSRLMDLLQTHEKLKQISESENKEEIVQILKPYVLEKKEV